MKIRQANEVKPTVSRGARVWKMLTQSTLVRALERTSVDDIHVYASEVERRRVYDQHARRDLHIHGRP